jgi:hypothetical protein
MSGTKLKFADEIHLDEERDVVWSHIVDGQSTCVMVVEMSREFLEDKHGTCWGDKRGVQAAFRQHRDEYLTASAAALKHGERCLKIYNATT